MPNLTSLTPILRVTDIREAIAYYNQLGFETLETDEQYHGEGNLYWAMLKCGEVGLMLNIDGTSDLKTDQTNYLGVDDVDAFHDQIKDLVEVTEPLKDQFYGVRDFWFTDRFGFKWGAGTRKASAG
ncbi:MAG: VOC family protein [Pseudomonadota bacterium]